jgi:FMN phosphatase YigB (HAD superfamily)
VALEAVVFDVGETLVDEERWWRHLADRVDLQPHVVWAALGVTIERGEEHSALWGHLGIESPPAWNEIPYSLDDLYPDAWACLDRLRALGYRVGIVGNQTKALESWGGRSGPPSARR